MTKWTKADIDRLWAEHQLRFRDNWVMNLSDSYLAAGLQADGSPKPEPIRCWYVLYQNGSDSVISEYPPIDLWERGGSTRIISGTFVPDGAE